VTDPENSLDVARDDLEEHEADLTDEFDRPLPDDVDEADAVDQKRDVPQPPEDEYPN
jgi:hypothetical protein